MTATGDAFLDQLYRDLERGDLLLPTLPEIALQVRETLENPDSSLADAAQVIARDAALSARLIHVANSPLLRASRPIETIEHAVARLGSHMVRSLVVGMAMEQLFQATSDITDRRLRAVWQHAMEVASIAHALSSLTRLRADQALLAGLLHDIGTLPILVRAEDHPALLHDEATLDEVIERAHADIGAAILRKWELPEEIVNAVREHENLHYDGGPQADYADLIIVANLQSAHKVEQPPLQPQPLSFAKLGLDGEVNEIDITAALAFA